MKGGPGPITVHAPAPAGGGGRCGPPAVPSSHPREDPSVSICCLDTVPAQYRPRSRHGGGRTHVEQSPEPRWCTPSILLHALCRDAIVERQAQRERVKTRRRGGGQSQAKLVRAGQGGRLGRWLGARRGRFSSLKMVGWMAKGPRKNALRRPAPPRSAPLLLCALIGR